MEPIHRRVAGLDVHRMKHVITVLIEGEDGSITKHTREFGDFKCDMKALIGWLTECQIELVILESTGIYWKSVFAHLEAAGIPAWVVSMPTTSSMYPDIRLTWPTPNGWPNWDTLARVAG
jgi:transposase